MKKHSIINIRSLLVLSLFIALLFSGLNPVQAKKLNAFLSYSTFYSPDLGPYIETYLMADGNSVSFVKNENGKFQASIQVIMLFRKGDEIANYDKYELLSPELDDTLAVNFNFIDQQRYLLENANYEFEIQIWDSNGESKPFVSLQPLTINYTEDDVIISGIQLVESYTKTVEHSIISKNGYDMIPIISNFYPDNISKITFYTEVYNTNTVIDEGQKFLVSYYLQTLDNSSPIPSYTFYKKAISSNVSVVFNEIDISKLPSGNYFLVIEARDQTNKVLGLNKIFIQRSNIKMQLKVDDFASLNISHTFAAQITNIDTLREYVRYLQPISSEQENFFTMAHIKTADLETLQKFFYHFWYDRNKLEPQKAWGQYLQQVNMVNMTYSTQIQKGYGTDRGRTYLKYGEPNAISESYNEPATYPYEIWHFYDLGNGQRNKKFVFYTRDLGTNDFSLLHSDVTGEISNYRWQYVLYERVNPSFNVDQGDVYDDSWGSNSRKYFDLPR